MSVSTASSSSSAPASGTVQIITDPAQIPQCAPLLQALAPLQIQQTQLSNQLVAVNQQIGQIQYALNLGVQIYGCGNTGLQSTLTSFLTSLGWTAPAATAPASSSSSSSSAPAPA